MDDRQGYFWPGEEFTRLLLTRQTDGSWVTRLYLRPLQSQYASPDEYREIVCVALQDEYKTYALKFRFEHNCTGVVKRVDVLSKSENSYYCAYVEVPKNDFWNTGSFDHIGGLTITFDATRRGMESVRKAK